MNTARIELRVKNNVLWKAIHDTHPSVTAFCRTHGLNPSEVCAYLCLTRRPWTVQRQHKGDPRPNAARLCAVTGIGFSELFPPELYADLIPKRLVLEGDPARFRSLMDARRVALPPAQEDQVFVDERRALIRELLATKLTPRQAFVIRCRFGIGEDEQTCEAIGARLGLGRARVQQIEQEALSKLRRARGRLGIRAMGDLLDASATLEAVALDYEEG